MNAIQALYQMSYIPVFGCKGRTKPARGGPAQDAVSVNKLLFRLDRADRAASFASAAIDANVRIDLILRVALGDRAHRAGVCASAAGNAIRRNDMCHCLLPPIEF